MLFFEVSLGSFLITSVASRQHSRPGHAPRSRDRAPCRGSDGRGQRLHGGIVRANSSSGFPARWTRVPRSPKCFRGWVRCPPGEGGRWLQGGIAAQGGENDAAWGQRELPHPQRLRKASCDAGEREKKIKVGYNLS